MYTSHTQRHRGTDTRRHRETAAIYPNRAIPNFLQQPHCMHTTMTNGKQINERKPTQRRFSKFKANDKKENIKQRKLKTTHAQRNTLIVNNCKRNKHMLKKNKKRRLMSKIITNYNHASPNRDENNQPKDNQPKHGNESHSNCQPVTP